MAKTPSKSSKPAKLPRDHFAPFRNLGRKIRRAFQKLKSRRQAHRAAHPPRHRSFRRSYREDYQHPVKTPGLLHHAVTTFQIIFHHWRPSSLSVLSGFVSSRSVEIFWFSL